MGWGGCEHSALYLTVVIYLSHGSILILIIFTADIDMGQLEVTHSPGSCYCIGSAWGETTALLAIRRCVKHKEKK